MLTFSLLLGVFLVFTYVNTDNNPSFKNMVKHPEDTHIRASAGYMLHRAWIQITNQKAHENTITQTPLSLESLSEQDFAIAWLGHATLLIRVGRQWVLTDPIFSKHATPTPPFGPNRLANLPLDLKDLPHIDVVLISHDHFDHLDLATVRQLANQPNGSPQFIAGLGLKDWFKNNVPNAKIEEFRWWDEMKIVDSTFQFVPAHHSSGRSFVNKNKTLWGGWVVEYNGKKLYFAGDTAYEATLFNKIKQRVGHINLAALPIGAYLPRNYMQFEHMDPYEAVQSHTDLQPEKSIAIHWGTFQLGDETSDEIRADFASALAKQQVDNFKLLDIGQMTSF